MFLPVISQNTLPTISLHELKSHSAAGLVPSTDIVFLNLLFFFWVNRKISCTFSEEKKNRKISNLISLWKGQVSFLNCCKNPNWTIMQNATNLSNFPFLFFFCSKLALSNLRVYTHLSLKIILIAATVYLYNKDNLLVTQINCNVSYFYTLC